MKYSRLFGTRKEAAAFELGLSEANTGNIRSMSYGKMIVDPDPRNPWRVTWIDVRTCPSLDVEPKDDLEGEIQ